MPPFPASHAPPSAVLIHLLLHCREEKGESSLIVNFDTDLRSSFFAKLYQHSGLRGGHVVMLGSDQASRHAASRFPMPCLGPHMPSCLCMHAAVKRHYPHPAVVAVHSCAGGHNRARSHFQSRPASFSPHVAAGMRPTRR